MKTLKILATTGLVMLGTVGLAQAQTSGTPGSLFPNAAPHEIQTINGVPCRTILDRESNQRIPVQCAVPSGMVGMDPMTTGSVLVAPRAGAPVAGTPASAFPTEIRMFNGVPCRTVLVQGTDQRVPVECAR
ncbi:hypothetical protein BB934_16945 [Microvirga ossetica]|uniref:Secreted protein n=1 Tax=Microvirga ossetica TaxID=1882682 RepID=A0A1B2EI87_9HYPH|nr:hypothetical protein [Microvirga ossetica]ANY79703.1 hypothetical protein BB934_16945 [Microvirga ossetica]